MSISSAELAYQALKTSILGREFVPGQRIKESALAEQLGISRTPLREAFNRLVSEGWLEQVPNQGVRVTRWTLKDIDDIFNVRLLLEPYATGCAARRMTKEHCAQLKAYAEQVETYSLVRDEASIALRTQANNQFHALLLDVAGNQRIVNILTTLVEIPLVSWTFHQFSEDEARRSTAHHFEIVAAISAGDASWAESVMKTHILAARQAVVERLQGAS
ncbi:MAG: GntR family transcriptional regulator [Burkholderiaceae bacterium]